MIVIRRRCFYQESQIKIMLSSVTVAELMLMYYTRRTSLRVQVQGIIHPDTIHTLQQQIWQCILMEYQRCHQCTRPLPTMPIIHTLLYRCVKVPRQRHQDWVLIRWAETKAWNITIHQECRLQLEPVTTGWVQLNKVCTSTVSLCGVDISLLLNQPSF